MKLIIDTHTHTISSGHAYSTIEEMARGAKDNGIQITIDSIAIDNILPLVKTNMTTLDIRAKTKGNWANTYIFLKELESLPFLVRLDKFALITTSDDIVSTNPKNVNNQGQDWQSVFEIHVLKNK